MNLEKIRDKAIQKENECKRRGEICEALHWANMAWAARGILRARRKRKKFLTVP